MLVTHHMNNVKYPWMDFFVQEFAVIKSKSKVADMHCLYMPEGLPV